MLDIVGVDPPSHLLFINIVNDLIYEVFREIENCCLNYSIICEWCFVLKVDKWSRQLCN